MPKSVQIWKRKALRDIRAWCKIPFDYEIMGLTLQQAQKFNLPTNPQKPNNYQWEALNDKQAEKLITEALVRYLDKINPRIKTLEVEAQERIKKYTIGELEASQKIIDRL